MYFEIKNPNSPGTKFNENTDKNILYFKEYIEKLGNSKVDYKEFQRNMELNKVTTESYIRSSFPFYKYAGIINNYTYIDKNLFTQLGEALYECLNTLESLKYESDSESKKLRESFEEAKKTIAKQALNNLIVNPACGYGIVFKKVLVFLLNYESIDETEFALIIDQNFGNKTIPIEKTNEILESYRRDKNSLTFKVQSVNKTTKQIQLGSKTNCFTYFTGTLEYAGYIYEEGKRYYLFPNTKETIVKLYGEKYE